jgi:L-ornithine Nalpha-acyltransferase
MRPHRACLAISQGRFTVKLVLEKRDLEAAFRLRFDVCNEELNKGLPESCLKGMDKDAYDDYCDHLVVIDTQSKKVVGASRMMPGVVAENSIGYYSESEFDLTAIRNLPGAKLELGRSYVHQDYRNAAIISMLWKGIAAYSEAYDLQLLFGCGSLDTANMAEINIVYSYLSRFHKADERYRVDPLKWLQGVQVLSFCDREMAFSLMPPLMKRYLRLGAQICGEPAFDRVFRTTDFFVLLDTETLLERCRRRFFREEPEHACTA